MSDDIIKCCAKDCPYQSSCYRHLAETNEENQVWFNYIYQCNFSTGFQDYIRVITN
jgi:hypothetical protein